MSKRTKKKEGIGKFLFLIIAIVLICSALYIFHDKLFDYLKPKREKKGISKEHKEVILYFMDPDSEYLIGERRKIVKKGRVSEEAKELIEELIKGSRKGLIHTIPSKARCLNIRVDEKGLAIVNFNKSLSKDHPGGSSAEMMTVYSIVNSLTLNFPEIRWVQIFIEGKAIDTISGHLALKYPVSPKLDLIKKND